MAFRNRVGDRTHCGVTVTHKDTHCGYPAWLSLSRVCLCRVSVLEVSGQIHLCSLAPEAIGSCGVLGSGTGLCFGLVLVGVLTSLVKKSWLLTSLETILVVQEACLPSQTLAPHFQIYTHTQSTHFWFCVNFTLLMLCLHSQTAL